MYKLLLKTYFPGTKTESLGTEGNAKSAEKGKQAPSVYEP